MMNIYFIFIYDHDDYFIYLFFTYFEQINQAVFVVDKQQ